MGALQQIGQSRADEPNSGGVNLQDFTQFGAAGNGLGIGGGKDEPVVRVEAGFLAPSADGTSQLIVTAQIERGWHIYSVTQKAGGPVPSRVEVDKGDHFKLTGKFLATVAPDAKKEPAFDNMMIETHDRKVTWFAPMKIVGGEASALKIVGRVHAQACNDQNCLPPKDYEFTAELSKDLVPQKAAAKKAEPAKTSETSEPPALHEQLSWQPFTSIASLSSLLGKDLDLKSIQEYIAAQARTRLSTVGAVIFGFLGGLILNVMPCVLPVIGLKLLSFIEQSGHDRGKAFWLNACYSLGLLAVFFVLATLAVFANLGWGQLFGKSWFIISLTGLVFVMGLSFLGVWEVPIPGFATRSAESELANQEGATGAFVKGALTTVLATPCVAPFLGPALVWAAAQPPWLTYAVMLSAGLGMAFPYLLIGAFPKLIGFLPKPGMWMETFKHVMGFVLMGTVVYFLQAMDIAFVVPTVGMLFGLWAGCWWIGRIPALADGNARAAAWAQAVAFASVVGVLMFPAFDDLVRPRLGFASLTSIMRDRLGYVNGIVPVSQPVNGTAAGNMASGNAAAGAIVATRPKAVMIDFTANWCLNCKAFESAVLNQRSVVSAVQRHNVTPIRADWTNEDPQITKLLEALNAGRAQIPVLAIFNPSNPNQPIVFPGPCTESELLAAIDKVAPLEKPASMADIALQR